MERDTNKLPEEKFKVVESITIEVKEFPDGTFIAYIPTYKGLSAAGLSKVEALMNFLEDYREVLRVDNEILK